MRTTAVRVLDRNVPTDPGRTEDPLSVVNGGIRSGETAASQIVLVRHGETEWSRVGRHTGLTDIPLDRNGLLQAANARHYLADLGVSFAKVFSSPLERAVETCVAAGYSSEITLLDDLVEWDYGDYEGRTTEEIRAEIPGWSLWADGVAHGESIESVAARADRVVSHLKSIDGNVIIFAHAHILRVLAARWIGLPPEHGRSFVLGPACSSILGYEHGATAILSWNNRE